MGRLWIFDWWVCGFLLKRVFETLFLWLMGVSGLLNYGLFVGMNHWLNFFLVICVCSDYSYCICQCFCVICVVNQICTAERAWTYQICPISFVSCGGVNLELHDCFNLSLIVYLSLSSCYENITVVLEGPLFIELFIV